MKMIRYKHLTLSYLLNGLLTSLYQDDTAVADIRFCTVSMVPLVEDKENVVSIISTDQKYVYRFIEFGIVVLCILTS